MTDTKTLSFSNFVQNFEEIQGEILSHMDPYYKKIDLHLGEYRKTNPLNTTDPEAGDYIVYVSGYWEILDSGETILSEENSQAEILKFFTSLIGESIISIKFFEDTLEVFFQFSNNLSLHIQSEDNRWIELVKRNGESIHTGKNSTFYQKTHTK